MFTYFNLYINICPVTILLIFLILSSNGNLSLQLGLVWLFSFVKVLEEDYDAVMQGVSIDYGAARKEQIDVSQSLGW
jgi:hypothetical protein